MPADTLMIQGTTSDAGKSTLVSALGRALYRRGIDVAPFKPQNMALNSAVTAEGDEIGRAQALQAQACGLAAHHDMNPILLKPHSDCGAQVIVLGQAVGTMLAKSYQEYKSRAMEIVLGAHRRLANTHQFILVEGAGSPAEINLRQNDIANMGFAEAVDCPVILVADIDRGGVFAHLIGTLELLSPSEQARVRGFVINRFRGDLDLLKPGIEWLESYSQRPVFGVLPYLHGLMLDSEDAIATHQKEGGADRFRIIVPVLPHISNHTDFDPLRARADVDLRFVGPNQTIPAADLVILPGSKNVPGDLDWLRRQNWENAIRRHLRYGGHVLGICGGFQMLGRQIHDPGGIESPKGSQPGLGYLDMETRLAPQKILKQVTGRLAFSHAPLRGYEIHHGVSTGKALERPFGWLDGLADGAVSKDGQIMGTYVHGLFDQDPTLTAILARCGWQASDARTEDYAAQREAQLERLADTVESHLDLERILELPESHHCNP